MFKKKAMSFMQKGSNTFILENTETNIKLFFNVRKKIELNFDDHIR